MECDLRRVCERLLCRPREWLEQIRWAVLDLSGPYRAAFDTAISDARIPVLGRGLAADRGRVHDTAGPVTRAREEAGTGSGVSRVPQRCGLGL